MAQHQRHLVGAEGAVRVTGGKIASITIAVTGDRVWTLHSGDADTDRQIYKLSAGVNVPHDELHIPFTGGLFANVVSGTTGEINIKVE